MRGRSRLAALWIAGAAALVLAGSQEATEPGKIFRDPFLENLEGKWKLVRSIRGKTIENTVDAEWVLNHQFLQIHMKDVAQPPTYEVLVMIGYDPEHGSYVAHWCDTWGGVFSAIARGKRTDDSIEFAFEYPDGPFFNTFTWDRSARTWTFRMENSGKDGKRTLFAIDSLRRP